MSIISVKKKTHIYKSKEYTSRRVPLFSSIVRLRLAPWRDAPCATASSNNNHLRKRTNYTNKYIYISVPGLILCDNFFPPKNSDNNRCTSGIRVDPPIIYIYIYI